MSIIHPVSHVPPVSKPAPVKPAAAPPVQHAASKATTLPPVKSPAAVNGSTLIAAQAAAKPVKPPTATPTASTPTATFVNLVEGDTIQFSLNKGASSTSNFTATGLPQWLTLNNKTGMLSGTVMAQDNQTYQATVTVEDSAKHTFSTQQLEINVLPHHYTGWNNANVTQLAEPTQTTTTTDAFGKTKIITYPSPATVG